MSPRVAEIGGGRIAPGATVGVMDRPAPPDIPLSGDERTLLVDFLDFYRAALVDRAFGLGEVQLQMPLPPSSLTLSRLIGHMAFVEEFWFLIRFRGGSFIGPWADLDWEADGDAEMTLAQTWSREELLAAFEASVAASRAVVAETDSLDRLSEASGPDGDRWDLRWILIHMIEEYARHCGHADFIRESIDGDVAG